MCIYESSDIIPEWTEYNLDAITDWIGLLMHSDIIGLYGYYHGRNQYTTPDATNNKQEELISNYCYQATTCEHHILYTTSQVILICTKPRK
jgi:hypothetical protein